MTKLIKHFHILIFAFTVGIIINPTNLQARSTGPAANGLGDRTGSPIGGGATCSGCHGGGAFSPSAQIELKDSNGTLVSGSIVSGETYTITLNIITGSGFPPAAYGFQLVVLDSANQNIGTFSNQSSGTQISPSGGVNFWEHSTPSTMSTFTVDWTPPAAMTMVTIYAIGNAVNGNGGTSGDEASAGTTFAQSLPVELMNFSID